VVAKVKWIINMSTKNIDFYFANDVMNITIGTNYLNDIAKKISNYSTNVFVIIDKNIYDLYRKNIFKSFDKYLNYSYITVDAIENNKNLDTLKYILDSAINNNISRNSVVVSIGGGIIGNIAGLVSGLLFRGISLIHIPTTLLAMSDSILSCKQAVNGEIAKNIYGLFHKAEFCGIDIQFLKTLPKEQFIAGFVEICKNVLTFDINNIDKCLEISKEIKKFKNKKFIDLNDELNKEIIIMGIEAKQMLLKDDPLEKKNALILEYGHTVGHAIELESNGKISHGIAVGLGMLVAAQISFNRGWLSQKDLDLHFYLLENSLSLTRIPNVISIEGILSRIKKDNKRGYIQLKNDEIPFILLKNIGDVEINSNLPLCAVNEKEIVNALKNHI
jgi:3-dehydroquinate synthase/2-deoxy-scyllo-inosose synthase